jgi:DNA-binding NarL/FixJ family response regulator
LAVVDLELSDGFSLLKELPRWAAGIRLIALTMQEDTAAVQRALRAGASGYVTRRDSQDELLKALQAALAGQRYVGLRVADCLLNTLVDGRLSVPNNGLERLTDREMETFCGLGQGKKVRTLAEEMGISAKTVEAHQARIRTKLEIADGAELRRQAALFMEASKAGAPKRRGGAAGKTARGRG